LIFFLKSHVGGMCMDKAVILARGLGTRMRQANGSVALDAEQTAAAESGIKALMPIKRPFLDYVISALADAGYKSTCLVIGPGNEFQPLRAYYDVLGSKRMRIDYAFQQEPRGTADAVAATEAFVDRDQFLAINADNYYPVEALKLLRELDTQGLVAFEKHALSEGGNIPPERIARYALLEPDKDGFLARITEKPSDEVIQKLGGEVYISMNCWRFGPAIFKACRSIEPSERGELEIASAVQYAIDMLGERFRVIPARLPVLDLTDRGDIAAVQALLAGIEVML